MSGTLSLGNTFQVIFLFLFQYFFDCLFSIDFIIHSSFFHSFFSPLPKPSPNRTTPSPRQKCIMEPYIYGPRLCLFQPCSLATIEVRRGKGEGRRGKGEGRRGEKGGEGGRREEKGEEGERGGGGVKCTRGPPFLQQKGRGEGEGRCIDGSLKNRGRRGKE